MMGHWHTLSRLWAMLGTREQARSSKFLRLMFLRPELLHVLPIGPHCLYDPGTPVYHLVGRDCDYLFD